MYVCKTLTEPALKVWMNADGWTGFSTLSILSGQNRLIRAQTVRIPVPSWQPGRGGAMAVPRGSSPPLTSSGQGGRLRALWSARGVAASAGREPGDRGQR